MGSGPQTSRLRFQRKSAAWGLATLSLLFVATWLAGKIFSWPWPDGSDWQAIWAFATFLVAAIAAAVALAQLAAHQESQRELSRPYIVVDFAFRSFLLLLEVKNIGPNPARDVKLAWDVEPQAMDERRGQAIKRNLVEGSIPFLAPGRAVRYSIGRSSDCWADESMPKRLNVVATYSDSRGNGFGEEEPMVLDLAQWAESLADSDYENKNWNQSKWQTEAQRKIATGLERIDSRLETLDESAKSLGEELRRDRILRRTRLRLTRRR